MNIEGLRVIVNGGSNGIGMATIKALMQRGAGRVRMLARNRKKVDAAMTSIASEELRGRGIPFLADVRDAETLSRAFQEFARVAVCLEVLVNNAGILLDGALISFSFRGATRYGLDDWQTTLKSNLRSVFLCSKLAVEAMFRKRIKGVIVNISSISRQGWADQTA